MIVCVCVRMALATWPLILEATIDIQRWNQVILIMQAFMTYALYLWTCLCYFHILTFRQRERLSMASLVKMVHGKYRRAQI